MATSKNDSSITNDIKIALLEQSIGHINESLIRLEKIIEFKFSILDKKFESIDKKFELIDKRFDESNSQMRQGFSECRQLSWGHFRWIMGTVIICILIPVVKGFAS